MSVNMLLSYAFFRTEDLAKYRADMVCGRLMIDSGAFTAYSTNKPIHVADYADFLTTWSKQIDQAVTLDVIGDPAATQRNTHWLQSRGHEVMPVFTRGHTSADFDAMVRDSGYVCVGGGVGMPQQHVMARLGGLQRRAEELGGGIHALGVGNSRGLAAIRPYSADAANISAAFVRGSVTTYVNGQLRSVPHSDRYRLRKLLDAFKDAGIARQVTNILKTGRMPNGTERFHLMQGMVLAGAVADEHASSYRVPVPHHLTDNQGTHLYLAITGSHLAPATAALDRQLHDPTWTAPPMWRRVQEQHATHCRYRTTVPT